MNNSEKQAGENIITPQKIWENLKRFWWFCVIPLLLCVAFVYSDTMDDYRTNQAAAAKDTYMASALVYYPTEDEETGKGNMVIFKSKRTLEKVNEILEANGYAPFDEGQDSMEVGHTMASYGITLIGEGKERMLCMGQAFAESMLEVIKEATGMAGYIVDAATVAPCMTDASGNTIIYRDVSQKQITLSLRSFLTWKKMMILCAGVFLGLALIFVAILFDKKVRSREDLEVFGSLKCMGVLGKKEEEEQRFLILAALCSDHPVRELALVSVGSWPKKASLSDLPRKLKEREEIPAVIQGEHAASAADIIEQCRDAGTAILMIQINRDEVTAVQKALANMEMAQVQVPGYILIE